VHRRLGRSGSMAAGLFTLSAATDTASVPVLVALMLPVGFGAGMAMPSATSLLLNSVPEGRSGTAGGVLNTSRQVGGALAIAAFGALVAAQGYGNGMKTSLMIAGALLAATMLASLRLRSAPPGSGQSLSMTPSTCAPTTGEALGGIDVGAAGLQSSTELLLHSSNERAAAEESVRLLPRCQPRQPVP
jgi:MFS family permease